MGVHGNTFCLVSLNCRGLNKKRKRDIIFKKCRRYDIVCLQETYITERVAAEWKLEWQGDLFYVEGTNKSKGQVILVNKENNFDSIELLFKTQRILALRLKMDGLQFDILNVYGPSNKVERRNFLEEINLILNKLNNPNYIICVDFNMI